LKKKKKAANWGREEIEGSGGGYFRRHHTSKPLGKRIVVNASIIEQTKEMKGTRRTRN